MAEPTDGGNILSRDTLSVVIPTYQRERVLVNTLEALLLLVRPGDEVLLIDQTPTHQPDVGADLERLSSSGRVRWCRRPEPGICRAMNSGACLARNDLLLFLDDDIVPSSRLLEVHRDVLARPDAPPATCGQVLQPWDEGRVDHVRDFAEGFHFAYSRECDVLGLMGGNFGIRRQTFLDLGGLDENFFGVAYRWEAELSYRIFHKMGRLVRFLPEASIRHLQAPAGGTRSYGTTHTWRHISGSVGDYYFAMKCLPTARALRHTFRRILREPVNRSTIRRPWVIPSLMLREVVAWCWALRLLPCREHNYIKSASTYAVCEPVPVALGEARS
jgi:GT2 family glycosyltransferase